MRHKGRIFVWIKIALALGAIVYLVVHLHDFPATLAQYLAIFHFGYSQFFFLLLLIALLPLNWGSEALKWRLLLAPSFIISFKTALRAFLIGQSAGVFTPNRTGDIVGRALVLPSEKRLAGIGATLMCGLSQNILTFSLGAIAFALIGKHFDFSQDIKTHPALVWAGVLVVVVLSTSVYFTIGYPQPWLQRFRLYRQHSHRISFLSGYSFHIKIQTLLLSAVRYTIYLTQYVLVLAFFGINPGVEILLPAIALTYVLNTLIPGFHVAEAGVRSATAVLIIGSFCERHFEIVLAASTLWTLNVGLASLLGLWHLARLNHPGKKTVLPPK